MIASLKETHSLYSNREIGLGHPDILLIPKSDRNHLGAPNQELKHYESIADAGLRQINIKQYDTILVNTKHINRILKMCLVFYGKQFLYKY